MPALNDLAAIAPPEGRAVQIGGRTLKVMPLRVRDIASVARRVRPFGDKLFGGLLGAGIGTSEMLDLLADHGEDFIAAVAIAARQDEEWVEGLEPHELMQLLVALVDENQDFFVHWLLPSITAMATTMTRALGGTPQRDSTPQATETG